MTISMRSLQQLPPKQALALALAEKARRRQYLIAQQEAQAAQAKSSIPQQMTPAAFAVHSSLLSLDGSPYQDLMRPFRYKVFYGGRDSAKSWSIAEALVKKVAYAPLRVLCTREYQNSVKDSVHALLKNTIYRLGLHAFFHITDKSIRSLVGGEFIFKGLHNNYIEVKGTEGVDICWVEEAHSTLHESWQVLIPTIRKPGSEIWISFNVTDEEAATYDRFVVHTPPNAAVHLVNFDQNPFLSDESRVEIAYLKEHDYHAYEHVYLGLPKKISDAIIFGGRYVVEGFADDLYKQAPRIHFGLDHGFARDPYALTRNFIINNDLYIEYEAFGVGVEFAGNIVRDTDESGKPRERGELEQLIDSVPGTRGGWPIKADNSRPETISFLRGKGFNVTAADKWKGSVEDGIAHIKGFNRIVIHDRCKHMQQEARLYSFKKDKMSGDVLPVIVDKNNHGWDSVRYSLDGYIQRRGDTGTWAKLGRGWQAMQVG